MRKNVSSGHRVADRSGQERSFAGRVADESPRL